jgi:glutathione S-transferase
MARQRDAIPQLLALRDRVAQRPRLLHYLTSPRRLPFSEQGIFRHYPELDG